MKPILLLPLLACTMFLSGCGDYVDRVTLSSRFETQRCQDTLEYAATCAAVRRILSTLPRPVTIIAPGVSTAANIIAMSGETVSTFASSQRAVDYVKANAFLGKGFTKGAMTSLDGKVHQVSCDTHGECTIDGTVKTAIIGDITLVFSDGSMNGPLTAQSFLPF